MSCVGGAATASAPTAQGSPAHRTQTWAPRHRSANTDLAWAHPTSCYAMGRTKGGQPGSRDLISKQSWPSQRASLWLEASGCWCSTHGQINWDSHPDFEYKHWKWHDHFIMLTPQLSIRRKETKILELSSPRSWRTWSQIWSLWQCGFCTQLPYRKWFIFNCRLIHGKSSESPWYFWQNPDLSEANEKLPMTSMGPSFTTLFLPSQYNRTFSNCSKNFWLLLKRDIINRGIFSVGSSNDCIKESLI